MEEKMMSFIVYLLLFTISLFHMKLLPRVEKILRVDPTHRLIEIIPASWMEWGSEQNFLYHIV